jgi:hypothetical protein
VGQPDDAHPVAAADGAAGDGIASRRYVIAFWGRCYNDNFLRFLPFVGVKMDFFSLKKTML